MKIIADENIPYLQDFFGQTDELVLKPGRDIQRDDLLDADILLVRSVTQVNQELLQNTPIKFVGSTTSGADHIDTEWLTKNNIAWYIAEGCNTRAVVEYVVCVIAALQKEKLLEEKPLRAAVIGLGKIGTQVSEALRRLHFTVINCDPYRAEQEKNFSHVNFADIADVDLITFHVPLTNDAAYPTFHMADKEFFLRQKKNCIVINTSRGSVLDFDALKEYGQTLYACLDVWEDEPFIDFDVLQLATIATPHIAGYSVQAKLRGIKMVYNYMLENKIILPFDVINPPYPTKTFDFADQRITWQDATLRIFDPMQLTNDFKQAMIENESQKVFDNFRKKFDSRYEFRFCEIKDAIIINKGNENDKNFWES